jgi:hypothetical protein
MQQLLTQGQIYISDYSLYAPINTTPRTGCYASSTFLTDQFFFDLIPSQMVENIDTNGAPIACSIAANGLSFAMVASLGNGKNLCVDSNNTKIESNTVNNISNFSYNACFC